MDLGLNGKVAVVTGGSVGIGLAIAEGLAAEGVNLVVAALGAELVREEAARIAGATTSSRRRSTSTAATG